MSDLTRYDWSDYCDGESGRCLAQMEPSSDGDWVDAELAFDEIDRLRAEIKRLRALLKEAADDIQETVEATYYGMDMYPHQRRRKERDMDLPRRIRAELEVGSDES